MPTIKKFKCALCPFLATSPSDLTRHIKSHTKEKPFKCKHCTASYPHKAVLTLHIRRRHSGPAALKALRRYKCEHCNFSAEGPHQLVVHLRRHTGEKPFVCPQQGCDKRFVAAKGLQAHIRIHSDNRPFRCEYRGCKFGTKIKSRLKEHWAVHNNERPFKCPVPECNYSAKLKSSLGKHTRVHKDPKFRCSYPGCGYKARQRINIRDHETVHSDYRPLQCPYSGCFYSAKRVSTLINHKKTHTVTKAAQPCLHPGCDRQFQSLYKLKIHEKLHNGEEPYRCDFLGCDHQTWYKQNLKQHQETHNNKQLTLPCTFSECTYIGKTRGGFLQHIHNHDNSVFASCPARGCNFRSKFPAIFARHVKVHEQKGKKYACPLCPCYYKGAPQYEAHLRTHNGEKPYECLDCQFRSARIEGITGHARRRHGRELSARDFASLRLKDNKLFGRIQDNKVQSNDWVGDDMNTGIASGLTWQPDELKRKFQINGVGDTTSLPENRYCFVPLVRTRIIH